jgi:hypothetical protein
MRRVFQSFLAGLTAVPALLAGNIYGTIREGNRPLQGASVSIACGGERLGAQTDPDGVYHVFARSTGPCEFAVVHNGRRMNTSVYSYDRPTPYDFDVVQDGNYWVLRRR